MTNRVGNFYTAAPLGPSPFRARLSSGSKIKEMQTPRASADCGLCYYPGGPTPGRLSLE